MENILQNSLIFFWYVDLKSLRRQTNYCHGKGDTKVGFEKIVLRSKLYAPLT